jgi:hypothetical protein
MQFIFPNEGLLYCLPLVLQNQLRFRLYTNNYAPIRSSTIGDFTQAAWSGYAEALLFGGNWTAGTFSGNVLISPYAATVTIGNTSGVSQSAYGFYIVDNTSMHVIWAAQFDTPPMSIPPGGAVFQPKCGMVSTYP